MSLATFLDEHFAEGRTSTGNAASSSTLSNWRVTIRFLKERMDGNRPVDSVSHEDAHSFRKWLDDRRIKKTTTGGKKGQPMQENAKRKHIENAKTFFNAAKRRGLIQINPFEYQASSTRANRDRDFYLSRDVTERIIAACPDAEWRLLVSLWRYAGLRKMEVFRLTWNDVLWDQGKLRVHSSKTAHHEGKDIRYVPLRDVRQYLDALYFDPETADGPIITRFTPSNSNLDKPCKVILNNASVVPWPKLFQNMRASCETDWLSEAPAHVVAGWIGHSVKVQRQNYAQITEGHFEKFNASKPMAGSNSKSGSDSASDEVRNDENSRESGSDLAHLRLSKNADDQRFCTRNGRQTIPEAGLEPAREINPTGF
jgi:integrase